MSVAATRCVERNMYVCMQSLLEMRQTHLVDTVT